MVLPVHCGCIEVIADGMKATSVALMQRNQGFHSPKQKPATPLK